MKPAMTLPLIIPEEWSYTMGAGRAKKTILLLALAALTLNSNLQAQQLVTIETVAVGDAGNAADTTGYGAVADVFALGKYEVTIGQYTSFLNAVAATDTYSLYNPGMATSLNIAGITRAGSSGNFSYSAIGSVSRPITYVSWFDAARFSNWMNNGATNGASTETGAYTLNGAMTGIITVNPGATWFLPGEDQWYKVISPMPVPSAAAAVPMRPSTKVAMCSSGMMR